MLPREPRLGVLIPARVRAGNTWLGSLIRNFSSRGMLLEMESPPPRGSFLEIARGKATLKGRVVWSAGRRCGIQTTQRITEEHLSGHPIEGIRPPSIPVGRSPDPPRPIAGGKIARIDCPDVTADRVARSDDPSPRTSGRVLLHDLELAHRELLAAIVEMERVTSAQRPDHGLYPGARYRLSRASRASRALVANACSQLLQRATSSQASKIMVLQSDAIRQLLESASHIQTWTLAEITENWPEYCEASARIRQSMRRRIEVEKATLYPIMREQRAANDQANEMARAKIVLRRQESA